MIILHVFDQIFKTNICHDKVVLDNVYFVQNLLSLGALLYSCKYVYQYYFENNIQALIYGADILLKFLAYDVLFIEKPSLYIHHGIVFAMLYQFKTIPHIAIETVHKQFATLLYTELSSIFLSFVFLQKYLQKRFSWGTWFDNVYLFNKLSFLVTFVITRLVYYPMMTIFNDDFYQILFKNPEYKYESYDTLLQFVGLFMLNIYWFVIILQSALFTN